MPQLSFDGSDGDINFITCRFDGSFQESRNPFTSKVMELPTSRELRGDEQHAVERVLAGATTADSANVLEVVDGGAAMFEVGPSFVSLKPFRGRPTPGLANVLFDVLVAGNWCIQADDALVVADLENARQLPPRSPRVPAEFYEHFPSKVVLVETAQDLANALGWS